MELPNLLKSIKAVSEGVIFEDAARVDRTRSFPKSGLTALAEVGALQLAAPISAGGAGGGLVAVADACETLGRACASTGMVFLMHTVTTATVAAGGGSRAGEILGRVVSESALGTLAFSEVGTGAHFYSPELRVHHHGDATRITGRKSFVTSGGQADFYLILVGSNEEGADMYLIEKNAPGVSFEGEWRGLGMAGNTSIEMVLEEVEVTEADRIGAPGKAADLVFGAVAPFFLVGLAAVNVGIAASAGAVATEHASNRRYPDGTSLAEIQYIQHRLADIDIRTRAARLLVAEAARLGDSGDEGALVPIMESKIVATEAAAASTDVALEITGGRGYTPSLPVERLLRDARAGAVMAPTNAVLRNWIGKALTGLPVP